MSDGGNDVFGGYQTPPTSPGVKPRLLERRKRALRKIDSAPALNNLPPLVNSPLSRHEIGDSPTEKETTFPLRADAAPDTPPQSPSSFMRHRGKFLKHASMPDMRRHLERHMAKGIQNQGDNMASPRSGDGSPDLLRKVLRRTTSTGSDDPPPPGQQSAGSSPLIHRRNIFSTQEAMPSSTNSSPLIRRKSSHTNGVSSLTNSPVPSPRISRRSLVSRQSSRPDTPLPAPRTSVSNNNYMHTNGHDVLVLEKIRQSLNEVCKGQENLADDTEHFVEQIRQSSSGDITTRRQPSDNCLVGGGCLQNDCIVKSGIPEEDGGDEWGQTADDDDNDTDEGIVLPIRETVIDETPEYQREPETPESRIEKWLVNIESERWRAPDVILPHISSTS